MFKLKTLLLSCALLSGSVLTGCSLTQEASSSNESNVQLAEYFADNGVGNPLSVVQHPAGIHRDGITYVSYQGPFEDPYIAAYNHKTGKWQGPYDAGTSELGRREERTKYDNHGKPTLLIDDEGYIHVFYGGHGGNKHNGINKLGNVHYGANKNSVSKRPLDISEWQEVDNVSVFGTYNQAITMDNGDIYLFYRHGAHRSDWVYQKSTDNGKTFGEAVSFLKHKRRTDLKAEDSWYPWVGHGKGDELIISFDYHICWDRDAHARGHGPQRHDAYFMTFNTKTGVWKNVEGKELTIPLTKEDADKYALAWDSGELWTFNGSSDLDANGFPHLAINAGKDLGQKAGGPKNTRHIVWDGKKWNANGPVNGKTTGMSRGDFEILENGDIRYLLADQDKNDAVLAYWRSTDNGKTFVKERELLRRPNASFAITTLIKDAHPDAKILVAEKANGNRNHKIYLVGENGAIKRPLIDATLVKDKSKFKNK